jgi:hypothetical protein
MISSAFFTRIKPIKKQILNTWITYISTWNSTEEEIWNLNYIEFSTSMLNGNPSPGIYRNLTQTDTTMEHKQATNLFRINTTITLPIIEPCKQ